MMWLQGQSCQDTEQNLAQRGGQKESARIFYLELPGMDNQEWEEVSILVNTSRQHGMYW